MQQRKVGQMLMAGLFLAGYAASANAATYYVATWGSNGNNGSSGSPWRDINFATTNSRLADGDLILVNGGTYTENVYLTRKNWGSRITLRANGSVTIKDPTPWSGNWQDGVIIGINARGWNIEGFRIEDASWGGVTLRSCGAMTVSRVYTYRSGASGIIAMPNNVSTEGEAEMQSYDIKVLDCTIEEAQNRYEGGGDIGSQEALSIWGVDGFEVARCKVFNGRTEGIDAKVGSRNGTIHHNEVYGMAQRSGLAGGSANGARNGGPGIYLDGNRAAMSNIQVYNNRVHSNKADAIAVADEDTRGGLSNIKIYNNATWNNGIQGVNSGAGIVIAAGTGIKIFNNTSVNDVHNLLIDGGAFGAPWPDGVEVRNNIFAGGKWRVVRVQESKNVLIDRNVVTRNVSTSIENAGNNSNYSVTNNIYTDNAGLTSTWRITSTSPARGAATWTGWSGSLIAGTDLDDQSRPQGNPDIGADEIS